MSWERKGRRRFKEAGSIPLGISKGRKRRAGRGKKKLGKGVKDIGKKRRVEE